jgi:hypothetical protein
MCYPFVSPQLIPLSRTYLSHDVLVPFKNNKKRPGSWQAIPRSPNTNFLGGIALNMPRLT